MLPSARLFPVFKLTSLQIHIYGAANLLTRLSAGKKRSVFLKMSDYCLNSSQAEKHCIGLRAIAKYFSVNNLRNTGILLQLSLMISPRYRKIFTVTPEAWKYSQKYVSVNCYCISGVFSLWAVFLLLSDRRCMVLQLLLTTALFCTLMDMKLLILHLVPLIPSKSAAPFFLRFCTQVLAATRKSTLKNRHP